MRDDAAFPVDVLGREIGEVLVEPGALIAGADGQPMALGTERLWEPAQNEAIRAQDDPARRHLGSA